MRAFWELYFKEIWRYRGSYLFFLALSVLSLGAMALDNPYYSGYSLALSFQYNSLLSNILPFFALLCVLFPAFLLLQSLHEELQSRSIVQSFSLPIPRYTFMLSKIAAILSLMLTVYILAVSVSSITDVNRSITWKQYSHQQNPGEPLPKYSFQDRIEDDIRAMNRKAHITAIFGCSFLLLGITAIAATIASGMGRFRARIGYITVFALMALFAVYAYDTWSLFGSRTSYSAVFLSFGAGTILIALYIFQTRAEA